MTTKTEATQRPCPYCGDTRHEAKEASNTCLAYLKSKNDELVRALEQFENVFAATDRADAGLRDFCVTDLEKARAAARAALQMVKGGE